MEYLYVKGYEDLEKKGLFHKHFSWNGLAFFNDKVFEAIVTQEVDGKKVFVCGTMVSDIALAMVRFFNTYFDMATYSAFSNGKEFIGFYEPVYPSPREDNSGMCKIQFSTGPYTQALLSKEERALQEFKENMNASTRKYYESLDFDNISSQFLKEVEERKLEVVKKQVGFVPTPYHFIS